MSDIVVTAEHYAIIISRQWLQNLKPVVLFTRLKKPARFQWMIKNEKYKAKNNGITLTFNHIPT